MKKFIWIPCISFLLEMIMSCFTPFNTSIFHLLFTLISIIIICPYFTTQHYLYYKFAFFIGLFYDLIVNNTLFLNAVIFLFIAFITYQLYQLLSNNLLTNLIISFLMIVIYRIISFIILLFIGYLTEDFGLLFHSISSSLLCNLIYSGLLFYLVRYLAKRWKIIKFY